MNRLTLASSAAAWLCLGLASPVLAAPSAAPPAVQPQPVAAPAAAARPAATPAVQPQPVAAAAAAAPVAPTPAAQAPTAGTMKQPPAGAASAAAVTPAAKCLGDLRAFDHQMAKTGYWLGGSGYGFGYPVGGYGGRPMGPGPVGPGRAAPGQKGPAIGYQDVRPGYEVRTLMAAADILAQHGQQQACENVLAATRSTYKTYVADMHTLGIRPGAAPTSRQQDIVAARPVAGQNTSFRSDELLGTSVVNPQGKDLGSVNDIVTSRQTGQIAYLVIGRGGVFGIGESYVPVPWAAFKVTPSVNLLVLNTTPAGMTAAPQVKQNEFKGGGSFGQESQKVNAYWKVQLAKLAGKVSKG